MMMDETNSFSPRDAAPPLPELAGQTRWHLRVATFGIGGHWGD